MVKKKKKKNSINPQAVFNMSWWAYVKKWLDFVHLFTLTKYISDEKNIEHQNEKVIQASV